MNTPYRRAVSGVARADAAATYFNRVGLAGLDRRRDLVPLEGPGAEV